jgi:ZIP family zinc transporter
MPITIQDVLPYLLIPVIATIVGAVAAAFYTPGPQMRSSIQHFAAGVVFAAVAGEVLPEVRGESPIAVIIGFALGVVMMLVIRELVEHGGEVEEGAEDPTGLVITVGVDLVIDGLLIGMGFAAGTELGLLLTLALTIEVLFLGLATATALSRAEAARTSIIGIPSGLAILLAISALIGFSLLGELSGTAFGVVLAFGAAALLYLVTEELLVEAHEVPETPVTTGMFFFGFLVLFVIEMFAEAPAA